MEKFIKLNKISAVMEENTMTEEEKRLEAILRRILPETAIPRNLNRAIPERKLSLDAEYAMYARKTIEQERIAMQYLEYKRFIG